MNCTESQQQSQVNGFFVRNAGDLAHLSAFKPLLPNRAISCILVLRPLGRKLFNDYVNYSIYVDTDVSGTGTGTGKVGKPAGGAARRDVIR